MPYKFIQLKSFCFYSNASSELVTNFILFFCLVDFIFDALFFALPSCKNLFAESPKFIVVLAYIAVAACVIVALLALFIMVCLLFKMESASLLIDIFVVTLLLVCLIKWIYLFLYWRQILSKQFKCSSRWPPLFTMAKISAVALNLFVRILETLLFIYFVFALNTYGHRLLGVDPPDMTPRPIRRVYGTPLEIFTRPTSQEKKSPDRDSGSPDR